MASDESMAHSGSDERPGCGENLAWAYPAEQMETLPSAAKWWYDELCDPGYDFASPGFSSGSGHFTQLVWKGSTKLGCGVKGGYVTCRYCEVAGNMGGAFETNVLESSTGDGKTGCAIALGDKIAA